MMWSAAAEPAQSAGERRTFQRVSIRIHGRYMLADRSEHSCQVIDMSPGSVALQCEHPGSVGERVIAYLDHIGRVEGIVFRAMPDGFAMSVVASERKKDKLAAQLTWLANRHELDLPEDRRHERVTPRNPFSVLRLSDGRQYRCRIVDLSLSGAAVETEVKPAMGVQVTLGTMRGQIIRHFQEGVAIEFATLQRAETLEMAFSSGVEA